MLCEKASAVRTSQAADRICGFEHHNAREHGVPGEVVGERYSSAMDTFLAMTIDFPGSRRMKLVNQNKFHAGATSGKTREALRVSTRRGDYDFVPHRSLFDKQAGCSGFWKVLRDRRDLRRKNPKNFTYFIADDRFGRRLQVDFCFDAFTIRQNRDDYAS